MDIDVLDLYNNSLLYKYVSIGKNDAKLYKTSLLPFALITPSDSSNKRAYTQTKNNIVFDDMLKKAEATGGYYFSYQNYYSMSKLISGISYDIKDSALNNEYTLINEIPKERKKYLELLSKYFYSISCRISSSQAISADYAILPVPDNLNPYSQDRLLLASQSLNKTTFLLWRSVAACIGYEDELKEFGLRDGDIVSVVDSVYSGVIVTNIVMKNHEGRLIPGHKVFIDSSTGERNKKNYPYNLLNTHQDNTKDFPYQISNNKLVCVTKKNMPGPLSCSFKLNEAKVVIRLGNHKGSSINCYTSKVINDPLCDSISLGCARFANRQANGIVSYFDENEELSLVIQTPEEEVVFKTLIKGSDRIPGGQKIVCEPIEGVALKNGQKNIDFYLFMGPPDKYKQLKHLSQSVDIDYEKEEKYRGSIPLKLLPSMVAGQGQAHVLVEPSKEKDKEKFKPMELDWEGMHPAYEENGVNKGAVITVAYLEEHFERTFPASLPPVEGSDYLSDSVRYSIRRFVESKDCYFSGQTLNHPRRPYRLNKGMDKFIKFNTFGSPKASCPLPISSYDRNLSIAFFNKLNTLFRNGNTDLLTAIGWTYHAEFFPGITEYILTDIEYAGSMVKGLGAPYFTCTANLIYEEESLTRFLRAFISRLRNPANINNWARGGYQVLMYHTEFLKNITVDEARLLMHRLINSCIRNMDKDRVLTNLFQCILFALKFRRFYSSYCKKDSDNDLDKKLYEELEHICNWSKDDEWLSMIKLYLEGKGTLSIPFGDDD